MHDHRPNERRRTTPQHMTSGSFSFVPITEDGMKRFHDFSDKKNKYNSRQTLISTVSLFSTSESDKVRARDGNSCRHLPFVSAFQGEMSAKSESNMCICENGRYFWIGFA